jgi:hypothetical protein
VITDAGGCTSTAQGTVVQPDSLFVREVAHTDAICYSTQTGSSTVIAMGGNTAFDYEWTDGNANIISMLPTATNLFAGTYRAEVSDENGCTASYRLRLPNRQKSLLRSSRYLATHSAGRQATMFCTRPMIR